jgi:hypothetical protein
MDSADHGVDDEIEIPRGDDPERAVCCSAKDMFTEAVRMLDNVLNDASIPLLLKIVSVLDIA